MPVQRGGKSSAQQHNGVGARGWVLARGQTRYSSFLLQHFLAQMKLPACKVCFGQAKKNGLC